MDSDSSEIVTHNRVRTGCGVRNRHFGVLREFQSHEGFGGGHKLVLAEYHIGSQISHDVPGVVGRRARRIARDKRRAKLVGRVNWLIPEIPHRGSEMRFLGHIKRKWPTVLPVFVQIGLRHPGGDGQRRAARVRMLLGHTLLDALRVCFRAKRELVRYGGGAPPQGGHDLVHFVRANLDLRAVRGQRRVGGIRPPRYHIEAVRDDLTIRQDTILTGALESSVIDGIGSRRLGEQGRKIDDGYAQGRLVVIEIPLTLRVSVEVLLQRIAYRVDGAQIQVETRAQAIGRASSGNECRAVLRIARVQGSGSQYVHHDILVALGRVVAIQHLRSGVYRRAHQTIPRDAPVLTQLHLHQLASVHIQLVHPIDQFERRLRHARLDRRQVAAGLCVGVGQGADGVLDEFSDALVAQLVRRRVEAVQRLVDADDARGQLVGVAEHPELVHRAHCIFHGDDVFADHVLPQRPQERFAQLVADPVGQLVPGVRLEHALCGLCERVRPHGRQ